VNIMFALFSSFLKKNITSPKVDTMFASIISFFFQMLTSLHPTSKRPHLRQAFPLGFDATRAECTM